MDVSPASPSNKKSKEIGEHLSKPLAKQWTSSVLVEVDPIASSPEGQSFMEAVQNGDMEAAINIFYCGNDELKKYCGKYLVSLGSTRLVELINGADMIHQGMDVASHFDAC